MKPEDDDIDVTAELQAANEALHNQNTEEAKRHLQTAAGAHGQTVAPHGTQSSGKKRKSSPPGSQKRMTQQTLERLAQRMRKIRRQGFWLGIVGYLILSLQQPLDWGMALWVFLAFLLIPGLIGLLIGWRFPGELTPGGTFLQARKAAGWAMAWYSAINLMVVRIRLHIDGGGSRFFAALLVMIVYSQLAGLVAGLVSAVLARRSVKGATA